MTYVTVIGGGLAGSEAAWQAAEAGAKVRLYEMRPVKRTPVHQTGDFAELVCSNSLKSNSITNAAGLLKEEMRRLESMVIACGDASSVPAGDALAVDRILFAQAITARLEGHPNIEIIREEVTEIPEDGVTIIATGPLTSEALAGKIGEITGLTQLHFYDAVAPTIDASTINREIAFAASRYDKGDDDAYLNCPMNREEYDAFYEALTHAELVPLAEHEAKTPYFEGCLPIEVLASRGPKTLCFGPMKPVGLTDPRTGRWPWACVQLRQENRDATLYSMVGFQTRMKWGDQKRVLRMIPGLEEAEFVRYGVIHRNTYIQSPQLLNEALQMKTRPNIFFAGQITGVEGYVESAAAGILAGRNAARFLRGEPLLTLPETTMLGALAHYVAHYDGKDFQPMNSNWGIVPPLPTRVRDKKEKAGIMAERAMAALETVQGLNLLARV
ncbi:methylenetetrahydrofolate--tRNA-(uracil-5-)-methyltransferase TrmFO [Capsulimonas corticalis]|uniref:Methylenetetrahydrofolate--tRNA-(uracil-5-)-methyltransferase TrmFO n=1 Tax=Capsulimonas corticalis TaxID=2219043 RepID=A0A402CQM9_9BACT|nr:methylenetetrahydrofolate--tRNA-(uracil(54)-C(5))-methyltransferase (FADH(2)-oxidizing) TrmFO [Capsulimonas corticalis]BDI32638.1 methylenetetrahydrofolate--tRNA-(uracil-5-)-methyltransferase TrmFO [Capsulimonas corticalis]